MSSLPLFARCLFCQRLECLPSWHRPRPWQCQRATSQGVEGSRALGGGWKEKERGIDGGREGGKERERHGKTPSLLPPSLSTPLCHLCPVSPSPSVSPLAHPYSPKHHPSTATHHPPPLWVENACVLRLSPRAVCKRVCVRMASRPV